MKADGKRYVKYEVIGKNDVAVPTHFFKAIFAELVDGNREEFAYIFPNEKIESGIPLNQFATTVAKVEQAAGTVFHVPKALKDANSKGQALPR